MDSNKEVYSTLELDNWRKRANENLIPAERYLIEKYLTDKSRNVIEAGTGGGRIAFNIEKLGFKNIWGFDYIPEMIEYAKITAGLNNSGIHFLQGDAVDLSKFDNDKFFYTIYLQQVISFIPHHSIQKAIDESYRVTAPDGTAIFSFLYYNGKRRNRYLSFFLKIIRLFQGDELSPQQLPWLIINHKINWKFFLKNQPVNYWFRKDEIISMLTNAGFEIRELKTSGEILNLKNKNAGMIYAVCIK